MKVRAAGAFVLGAASSAALLAAGLGAAFWTFPTAQQQQPPASVPAMQAEGRGAPAGGIASWPEIRNGVPEMIAPAAAPAVAPAAAPQPAPVAPPPAAPAVPPAPAPSRPAIAVADPPPVPDPMLGLRPSEPPPEAPPLRRAAQPGGAERSAPTAVAAAPDPAWGAGDRDEQAVRALTPLPPRRPILEQPALRRPAPVRQRAAVAPPLDPAPAAPPEPAPAERSILGLPIPDLIPSGRRVRECLLELKC
jgi:hypothetical protein